MSNEIQTVWVILYHSADEELTAEVSTTELGGLKRIKDLKHGAMVRNLSILSKSMRYRLNASLQYAATQSGS